MPVRSWADDKKEKAGKKVKTVSANLFIILTVTM